MNEMAFRCSSTVSSQPGQQEGRESEVMAWDVGRSRPRLGCEGMWTFRVQKLCHWNKLWAVASCWVLGTKTESHSSPLSKTSFMWGGHRWQWSDHTNMSGHSISVPTLTVCYLNDVLMCVVFRCATACFFFLFFNEAWQQCRLMLTVCHQFQSMNVNFSPSEEYFLMTELRLKFNTCIHLIYVVISVRDKISNTTASWIFQQWNYCISKSMQV